MQYKSITYKRVIVPKAYESKHLEVTVELSPDDDAELITKILMADVEEILQTAHQYLDAEHLTTTGDELRKEAILRAALNSQKNLDDIGF